MQRKRKRVKPCFVCLIFMIFLYCTHVNQPVNFEYIESNFYMYENTDFRPTLAINIEKIVSIDFIDNTNIGTFSKTKPTATIFFSLQSPTEHNAKFLDEKNSNYAIEIFVSDTPFFSLNGIKSHILSRQIEMINGQRVIFDTTFSSGDPNSEHPHIWGFMPAQIYNQSDYFFWQAQINLADGSTLTIPPKPYGYPTEKLRDYKNTP